MGKNIFENAYFGKAYKTRDGRKAIFSRKDGDTFDLETEESYNPVREDGSFLYTKEGYESSCDIISEWHTEIDEQELDKLANSLEVQQLLTVPWDDCYEECVECFKAGYRKAMEE